MPGKQNVVRDFRSFVGSSNKAVSENGRSASRNRPSQEATGTIAVINPHSIILDCLEQALRFELGQPVVCVSAIEKLGSAWEGPPPSLVVLFQFGLSKGEAIKQVELLSDRVSGYPIVVVSDRTEPDLIVEILAKNVQGYIPTSSSLNIAIQSIQLVQAGGVYVPASSLIAARQQPQKTTTEQFGTGLFTARQAAVVEALMRGKANKIIAYELNLKESTVKVHVRNIMKKLRASNRTQVAYIANRLMNGEKIAS